MDRSLRSIVTFALLVGLAGCGAGAAPRAHAPEHDRPVAASEPRATLTLSIDLEPGARCEERFDLALYRDRRIELLAWDERRGACSARQLTIRYLSRALDRPTLLALVRKLARRAQPLHEIPTHAKP